MWQVCNYITLAQLCFVGEHHLDQWSWRPAGRNIYQLTHIWGPSGRGRCRNLMMLHLKELATFPIVIYNPNQISWGQEHSICLDTNIHRLDGSLPLLILVRDIFCFIWEKSIEEKKNSHIWLSKLVKAEEQSFLSRNLFWQFLRELLRNAQPVTALFEAKASYQQNKHNHSFGFILD